MEYTTQYHPQKFFFDLWGWISRTTFPSQCFSCFLRVAVEVNILKNGNGNVTLNGASKMSALRGTSLILVIPNLTHTSKAPSHNSPHSNSHVRITNSLPQESSVLITELRAIHKAIFLGKPLFQRESVQGNPPGLAQNPVVWSIQWFLFSKGFS